MDMGIVRGLLTVVIMGLFLAICYRAFVAGRRGDYDEAAKAPLKSDAETLRGESS